MINKSTVVTALLLFAGSAQLSFFGLLPYNYKFIGDAALVAVCFLSLQQGWLRPLPDRWSKAVFHLASLFVGFSFFIVLYSIVIWGDLFQTLTWSRRWLVSGVYLMLASSLLIRHLHWKMAKTAFFIFPAFAAAIQYLERSQIVDFAGIRSNMEWQGGYQVIKMYTPTAVLITVAFILSVHLFFTRPRLLSGVLLLGWSYVFFDLINFRGYWIAGLLSIVLTMVCVLLFRGDGFKTVRGKMAATILGAIALSLAIGYNSLAENLEGRIEWLQSAVTDANEGSGNIQWRLENDASRLNEIWEGPVWLYKIYGIGFVGEGSSGFERLGFTSETNDSGWVEVLLTGGIPAALVLLLLWSANIIRFFSLSRRLATPYMLAGLSTVLATAAMMYTSNYLLWDFGFVPVFWVQVLALSSYQKSSIEEAYRFEKSAYYGRQRVYRESFD
mgnify:CR=1 FL=1